MPHNTGQYAMIKHARYTAIKNITHYHRPTTTAVRARNCHERNVPMTNAKHMSNQKSGIIGFRNQRHRHASKKSQHVPKHYVWGSHSRKTGKQSIPRMPYGMIQRPNRKRTRLDRLQTVWLDAMFFTRIPGTPQNKAGKRIYANQPVPNQKSVRNIR